MSRALVLSAAIGLLAFADARAATDPSASQESSSDARTLAEVTVQAQRETLTKRVTAFVDRITGNQFAFQRGLTLWRSPVCPLVSGVPSEEGEFIIERLSEVARADAIPLAGVNCHPNLFVLVSGQPQELLRAMSERNIWFTYGFGVRQFVIDEFISKSGPVRVLYRDFPSDPCLRPPCEFQAVSTAKVGPITMSGDGWTYDSHSSRYHNVWQVFRVFVVVDASQVKGVTLGQFADYVALVSLAQLKPADSLEDAPTILKLFSGAPQAAPAGMTEWDRAFLKSLYATDQSLHVQRSRIEHAMVSEIVH